MTSSTDPNYGKGEVTIDPNDSLDPVLKLIRTRVKEAVTQETFEIPLLPTVATQVLQMANNPKVGFGDLEKLVKQDQVIAAKIIQVANSPAYRGMTTIVSLREAMNRLGLRLMKDIVFSLSIQGKIFQVKNFENELKVIWEHSLSCAAISQLLAKKLGIDNEYGFLAGLLHDIGKVVLIQVVSKLEEEERKKKGVTLKDGRIDKVHEVLVPLVFQEYHAIVGTLVATKWKLPNLITEVLRYHHEYAKSENARSITTVVYLANILCHHFGYGHEEEPVELMNEKAFFELNFTTDQVKKLVDEIPPAVDALRSAL